MGEYGNPPLADAPHVDHHLPVASADEPQIEAAIRFLARAHGLVAEGAGAVPVAALMSGAVEPGEGATVLVISGRNIALERLAAVLLGRTSTPAG